MAIPSALLAKAAAIVLSSDKGRKVIGWIMVAIFSPLILIAAFLCSAASGGADHNNLAVEASFYGDILYGVHPGRVPDAYLRNAGGFYEAGHCHRKRKCLQSGGRRP